MKKELKGFIIETNFGYVKRGSESTKTSEDLNVSPFIGDAAIFYYDALAYAVAKRIGTYPRITMSKVISTRITYKTEE